MATLIRFTKTTGIQGTIYEDGDECFLEDLPEDCRQSLRSLNVYVIVPEPEPKVSGPSAEEQKPEDKAPAK